MTTRPYELLARFGNDGKVAGVSVRTITTVNGREFESDPQPLSGVNDPAFVDFAKQFAAVIVAERDQLKADLATKSQELSTLTTSRDSLQSQLAQANESAATKDATIAEHAALRARIEKLLDAIPFDPREISLAAFKARLEKVLSPQDLIRLYAAATDPILEQIAATIVGWDDKTPIRLDSRELREPLGYLLAVGLINETELAFLVSDSNKEEAFYDEATQ